jgi:hypothetical protein
MEPETDLVGQRQTRSAAPPAAALGPNGNLAGCEDNDQPAAPDSGEKLPPRRLPPFGDLRLQLVALRL